MQDRRHAGSSARGSDDFTIAVKTLLLTAPHMTRQQLSDVARLAEELLKARPARGRREPLFSQPDQRPAERRSFSED